MQQPTKDQLRELIIKDVGLSPSDRSALLDKLSDDNNDFYEHLVKGGVGASLGYVLAKYMDLSSKARLLLSIAGFGIGTYVLDSSKKHDKFLTYNKEQKVYEIKQ